MMMNKIKVIALVALLAVGALVLSGCSIGNRQIGIDLTQSFRWAIVDLGNGELIEGQVTAWRDFDESDVVQFTIDGITYLTHYSRVILCTQKP
jgi:predicted small secreted protein